jgi:hypothetical protein
MEECCRAREPAPLDRPGSTNDIGRPTDLLEFRCRVRSAGGGTSLHGLGSPTVPAMDLTSIGLRRSPPYPDGMDHRDSCANAIRTEPGQCWRMISRTNGYRVGTPPIARSQRSGSGGLSWAGNR